MNTLENNFNRCAANETKITCANKADAASIASGKKKTSGKQSNNSLKIINSPKYLHCTSKTFFFDRNCICLCYPLIINPPCPILRIEEALDKFNDVSYGCTSHPSAWRDDNVISGNTYIRRNIINNYLPYVIKKGREIPNNKKYAIFKVKSLSNNEKINLLKLLNSANKQNKAACQYPYFVRSNKRLLMKSSAVSTPIVSLEPTHYRLVCFQTGITFFLICFKLDVFKSVTISEESIFLMQYALKKLIRSNDFQVSVKNLINKYLNKNIKDFEFLDEKFKKVNNKVSTTNRFSLFSILNVKNKNSRSLIPYWLTGLIATKTTSKYPAVQTSADECSLYYDCLKKCIISPNRLIVTSQEGCCAYTAYPENTDECYYLRKHYDTFSQHVYIEYILVLHQFYLLHKLNSDFQNNNCDKIWFYHTFDEYLVHQFTDFETKHLYEIISITTKYQTMYSYMKSKLKIDDFSKEVKETLLPKITANSEKTIRRLTIVSVSTGIISIALSLLNNPHYCVPRCVNKHLLTFFIILICIIILSLIFVSKKNCRVLSELFFAKIITPIKHCIVKIKRWVKRLRNKKNQKLKKRVFFK